MRMRPDPTPTVGAEAAQAPAPSRSIEDAELISRLSNRILVSRFRRVGTEVRIRLKPDLLGGAEVSVIRDANGLTVRVLTDKPDVAQKVDDIAEQLSAHMRERTGGPVRVEAQLQAAQAQPSQAAHQARDGAGREGGDGRSRNRQDPWDTLDPDGDP